jgi:hypothetical protein
MQNTNYTTAIEVAESADVVFNHLINNVSKFWPEEHGNKRLAVQLHC